MGKESKRIMWLGTSLSDLSQFPVDARRIAGRQLRRIQEGDQPTDAKPLHEVGAGVYEIRIHYPDAYRVFYVAKFADQVFVLHAFQKNTRKTSEHDIKLGQQRYNELKERLRKK